MSGPDLKPAIMAASSALDDYTDHVFDAVGTFKDRDRFTEQALTSALPHILDALAEEAEAESDAQPHWVAPRIAAGWIRHKAAEVRRG